MVRFEPFKRTLSLNPNHHGFQGHWIPWKIYHISCSKPSITALPLHVLVLPFVLHLVIPKNGHNIIGFHVCIRYLLAQIQFPLSWKDTTDIGLVVNHAGYASGNGPYHGAGAHFNNKFSIVIQIQWKFYPAAIQVVGKWLLWNFAHGTTAVLLWHVQNFVAIFFVKWVPERCGRWETWPHGTVPLTTPVRPKSDLCTTTPAPGHVANKPWMRKNGRPWLI